MSIVEIWNADDPWKSPFLVDSLDSGILYPLYDKEPEIIYAERIIYNDNQRTST